MAERPAVAAVVGGDALTLGDAVAAGARRLAAAGCDTPRLDAELLLSAMLGVGRERLVLDRREPVQEEALGRYEGLLERREAREPVAYILGYRDFRRLRLAVDRRVLVPRPETELLVEVGLSAPVGARVADVGTGSGAVGLALADERPDLRVRGLDISPEALDVAHWNARRLGLRVTFGPADLLDGHGYDAVLANLPYVCDDDPLPPEVALWEPPGALRAGPDGLDSIRRLIASCGARADVALVAVELDPRQADAVHELLAGAGFRSVQRLRDLAGRERVLVGRR